MSVMIERFKQKIFFVVGGVIFFSCIKFIAGKEFRRERSPFFEYSKPLGHSYYRLRLLYFNIRIVFLLKHIFFRLSNPTTQLVKKEFNEGKNLRN